MRFSKLSTNFSCDTCGNNLERGSHHDAEVGQHAVRVGQAEVSLWQLVLPVQHKVLINQSSIISFQFVDIDILP